MNDIETIPPWNTGTPTTPHRTYVVFYETSDGGYYGLATWTGERWIASCTKNTDAPAAWMWLPDGPTGGGAGQPRKVVIELNPPWPTDADVDEYLKREGLRRGDGEVENYVGFARERAELARVTAETVASAAIPPEMMGEPGSLAEARTFDQLYCRGPFLGSPVPEPEVRLPADWRERRTADEDCGGDFIEAHAEPGSIGAELAERLDRPGPREVLVVAGAPDLRGVPERLALPEGRAYVMVLADDDPIVKQLRAPEPMSMSVSVRAPEVCCTLCGLTVALDERVVGQASGPRGVILHDDEVAHQRCLARAVKEQEE